MATFKMFKVHLRIPFLVLAALEFLICILSVYIAVYVRFDGKAVTQEALADYNIDSLILSSILFGLVMPITMMAMGLYQSRFRGGVVGVFLRSIIGFASGAMILALIYYLIPSLYLGRGVFAIAILIAFFMVGTIRPLFFYYVDQDVLKIRVLVLGAGERSASIDARLRRRVDRRGFRIVGYLPLPQDSSVAIESHRICKINTSLLAYCKEHEIDEIVVAPDEKRANLPMPDLLQCKLHGIDVIDILGFFEREQGKLPLDIMRPDWLIYSEGFDQGAFRDISKRVFDFIASGLILLLTWPFMLMVAIAIKIEDGWSAPVIYHQVRVGYLGREFSVYKFRSMSINAESDGVAQWAQKNDTRITRVGAFARKTRIDELPQIFNVLIGDMSFVGPRPERPQFVDTLSDDIPYYHERHGVKPGITGWAQVSYPYGASLNDSVQKQEFDLFYIKNRTLFLDVLILCQTAEVVLFGKGGQ